MYFSMENENKNKQHDICSLHEAIFSICLIYHSASIRYRFNVKYCKIATDFQLLIKSLSSKFLVGIRYFNVISRVWTFFKRTLICLLYTVIRGALWSSIRCRWSRRRRESKTFGKFAFQSTYSRRIRWSSILSIMRYWSPILIGTWKIINC